MHPRTAMRTRGGVRAEARKLGGHDRRALLANRRHQWREPSWRPRPIRLDAAAKGEGYFGYKYKILTGQGDQIAGGAYDYVINGNMIAGFGLIAWPAKYAETGVKTFAVNQLGVIYRDRPRPKH